MSKLISRPESGRNWFVLSLGFFFAALAVALNYDAVASLTGYHHHVGLAALIALELAALVAAFYVAHAAPWARAIATVMLVLSLFVSASGAIAFRWKATSDATAERIKQATEYSKALTEHDRLSALLTSYEAIRPTESIYADLDRCPTCKAAPRWRLDLAEAEKRDGLVASAATAADRVAYAKPTADTAGGFALFMHAMFGLDTQFTERLSVLMFVLAMQLGAPAFIALGNRNHSRNRIEAIESGTPNHSVNHSTNHSDQSDSTVNTVDAADSNAFESNDSNAIAPTDSNGGGMNADPIQNAVVALIRAAGGTIRTTKGDLAETLGESPAKVRDAIKGCEAGGRIKVESRPRIGTTLSLVGA